jgi:nicotinamide riboside transporter PnuC
VLTIIGFTVTIIGVLRAKSAAEQARDAVTEVRKDILQIDMVSEFSSSLSIWFLANGFVVALLCT